MMLSIAIIGLVGMLISFLSYQKDNEININTCLTAITVIAWWKICLPLAIIILVAAVVIGIIGAEQNKK
jgi:hypothetical protein